MAGRDSMARVLGLGHVGIYVRDLDRMVAFYRDVMGMRVTKQNRRAGVVFLSADPESVDHALALMGGRPDPADPHLINQISMRVGSLDDLRAMHRRLLAEGYRIEGVVNHASAVGCDFFDPEDNRTEVFWVRRQLRFGVAGMSTWVTPRCDSASTTALITAAGEPMVPTSPQPFTPIGVCVHSVEWVSTFIIGM